MRERIKENVIGGLPQKLGKTEKEKEKIKHLDNAKCWLTDDSIRA